MTKELYYTYLIKSASVLKDIGRTALGTAVAIGSIELVHQMSKLTDWWQYKRFVERLKKDPDLKHVPEEDIEKYAWALFELNPKLAKLKSIAVPFIRSSHAIGQVDPNMALKLVSTRPFTPSLKASVEGTGIKTQIG